MRMIFKLKSRHADVGRNRKAPEGRSARPPSAPARCSTMPRPLCLPDIGEERGQASWHGCSRGPSFTRSDTQPMSESKCQQFSAAAVVAPSGRSQVKPADRLRVDLQLLRERADCCCPQRCPGAKPLVPLGCRDLVLMCTCDASGDDLSPNFPPIFLAVPMALRWTNASPRW